VTTRGGGDNKLQLLNDVTLSWRITTTTAPTMAIGIVTIDAAVLHNQQKGDATYRYYMNRTDK
jgi:hypothetical protein